VAISHEQGINGLIFGLAFIRLDLAFARGGAQILNFRMPVT
jgi:hypothetical protein